MPSVASTSATTAHTLVVPMSRPTTISPCEAAELISPRQSHGRSRRGPSLRPVRRYVHAGRDRASQGPRFPRLPAGLSRRARSMLQHRAREPPTLRGPSCCLSACGGARRPSPGDGGAEHGRIEAVRAAPGEQGGDGGRRSGRRRRRRQRLLRPRPGLRPRLRDPRFGDVATCASRLEGVAAAHAFGATGVERDARPVRGVRLRSVPQRHLLRPAHAATSRPCQPVPGTLAAGAACAVDAPVRGDALRRAAERRLRDVRRRWRPRGRRAAPTATASRGMTCVSQGTCVGRVAATTGPRTPRATRPSRAGPDLGCVGGACTAPSPVGAACRRADECDAAARRRLQPAAMMCENVSLRGRQRRLRPGEQAPRRCAPVQARSAPATTAPNYTGALRRVRGGRRQLRRDRRPAVRRRGGLRRRQVRRAGIRRSASRLSASGRRRARGGRRCRA